MQSNTTTLLKHIYFCNKTDPEDCDIAKQSNLTSIANSEICALSLFSKSANMQTLYSVSDSSLLLIQITIAAYNGFFRKREDIDC